MNLEESTKMARETRFAVLGRELADRFLAGKPYTAIEQELAQVRTAEQNSIDCMTAFAGLARQVGDAVQAGRDTALLVGKLVLLRKRERGCK